MSSEGGVHLLHPPLDLLLIMLREDDIFLRLEGKSGPSMHTSPVQDGKDLNYTYH